MKDKSKVKQYESFIRGSEFGSLTQDIMWPKVKTGWDSVCFYVEKDGEITGAVTVLFRSVLGFKMLYAPRGPVCDIYDYNAVNELIAQVDEYAKKNNGFMLRIDPETVYDTELEELYKNKGFRVRNRNYDKDALIQPRFNMVLSLDGEDEESLLKSFANKTRYNIRLADKKGVTVRYSKSKEDLKIFYKLNEIMSKRQKIYSRGYEYFEDLLNTFEGDARIYIAEHEGEPLAAAVTLLYSHKLWYMYGASSNEKRNLMPNYLMQWEMIKWGLEDGAKRYDFGGVFELNIEDGLYKFKEGFCRKDGVTELIGEIDKVYNPIMYNLVVEIYPRVQKLKKAIKKKLG